MVSLETSIAGVMLKNPTVLVSGIMDTTVSAMASAVRGGAAAVTTKSVGSVPRKGNANPIIVEVHGGFLNAVGLANPGIDAFREEVEETKKLGVPLIASVFGGDEKEFAALAQKMESYGADAMELNLSCPHSACYGMHVGADPELLRKVVSEVKNSVKVPVIAKLTPNVYSIKPLAKAAKEAGADAISAINTLGPGMAIDINAARPVLSNRVGGMSGPAIKPIAVRCVYEITETVDLPVIGIGGITNGADAVEMMMAGASAVGIGTAVRYRGIDVFTKVCSEVDEFMSANGYSGIKDIRGIAHR